MQSDFLRGIFHLVEKCFEKILENYNALLPASSIGTINVFMIEKLANYFHDSIIFTLDIDIRIFLLQAQREKENIQMLDCLVHLVRWETPLKRSFSNYYLANLFSKF